MSEIQKVAIANRGEVAVRIIRACQELGIKTVLLHSEADVKTRAHRLSDEQVCIGPAELAQSYLSIDRNIQGAISAGADAIHPGFGFLSENADFAQACMNNKLIFIGPWPQTIRDLGDKIIAKRMVEEEGIPTVPGYDGADQSVETLTKECEKIGFPIIIKAAAGGGGRGMKVANNAQEVGELITSAQREAQSSFGSSRVFLEKYLGKAKHIEVQIFGDLAGQSVHLYERDCSIQRRHQKVIEESIATNLDAVMREEITAAAVRLAKKVNYVGAGTVEFLVQDENYYFMEMNTRLQVEHPVTELVMGVDLVKAQILTMTKKSLTWDQRMLRPRGHAIECRIYAEDSHGPGIPSTGTLLYQYFPDGPGRRFDYGFDEGDIITPYYDSMIAKVIVWDENRPRAIMKMLATLKDTVIFGVKTNIPFLMDIIQHPEFIEGNMTTQFIPSYFPQGAPSFEPSDAEKIFIERALQVAPAQEGGATPANPWVHPWRDS